MSVERKNKDFHSHYWSLCSSAWLLCHEWRDPRMLWVFGAPWKYPGAKTCNYIEFSYGIFFSWFELMIIPSYLEFLLICVHGIKLLKHIATCGIYSGKPNILRVKSIFQFVTATKIPIQGTHVPSVCHCKVEVGNTL